MHSPLREFSPHPADVSHCLAFYAKQTNHKRQLLFDQKTVICLSFRVSQANIVIEEGERRNKGREQEAKRNKTNKKEG